jgi:hypothetical protein
VGATLDKFGGADILFANAGMEGPCAPITELAVDDCDRVQAVDVRGAFLGIREVAPVMAKRGGGSIVITSIDNRMMRSIEDQLAPGQGTAVKQGFEHKVALGRGTPDCGGASVGNGVRSRQAGTHGVRGSTKTHRSGRISKASARSSTRLERTLGGEPDDLTFTGARMEIQSETVDETSLEGNGRPAVFYRYARVTSRHAEKLAARQRLRSTAFRLSRCAPMPPGKMPLRRVVMPYGVQRSGRASPRIKRARPPKMP